MDYLLNIGQAAVGFLSVLTVLVFVHEWGHYIVARMNGVRVEVFSIGFGPEIWGFNDKNGTRWKFSWIPLGGYVKFFGDASEASTPDQAISSMTEEEKKVSFHHKSLLQKSAIVFAGPAVNFLFAIVVIAGLYLTYGRVVISPVVGEVMEGSAAEQAGILAGDRIIRIDGEEIVSFGEIREHLYFKVEEEVGIVLIRDGQEVALNFTLNQVDSEDILGQPTKMRQIGIRSSVDGVEHVKYGPIGAVWQAVLETGNIIERNAQGIGQMVAGDRSVKELGGPITIARVAGKTIDFGWEWLVNLAATVSIGLGMVNLLPIPVLDGGHLLYYAIEGVRRRKMSLEAQEVGFRIGMFVVLTLMVFVFYNDVAKLI